VIHNPNDPLDIIPGYPGDDLTNDPITGPVIHQSPDLPGGLLNRSPLTEPDEPPVLYRKPPNNAQYLQLFHSLGDGGECINGRKYLGNTPTMVAGPDTMMRFGVVGMGDDFHTFHLHGHRWVILGPDGDNATDIQSSIQNRAVSQFEDTRIFGPANSFAFTIQETSNGSSFMGTTPGVVGEFHMHCHVLGHMMMGMIGSLKIVKGGDKWEPFHQPKGDPALTSQCP
jgi:FtsP/CotA-like multicopper oxidase with cupredoxin domain